MRVATQDLYCGAYILSKGGSLEEIQLAKGRSGRPSVTFVLTGENVETLSREFQTGQANTNVVSLMVAMTHLKDVMFQTLRREGGESPASPKEKRENDRAKKNRERQVSKLG